MPEHVEDISLVENTATGPLAIPVSSRRNSPCDVPVNKTQSEESFARTSSEPSLQESPPESPRARTSSDGSRPSTPRRTSLTLPADERGPHDPLLATVGKVPQITVSNSATSPDSDKLPTEDEEPRVQDSAYSWVVAGGSALQFVLVGGIHKSFGLMLAALVQQHGFTAAQVAVIPALYFSINFLVSPLCGALCRRLTERRVAIMGGIGSMLGLALSALTSDIYMLYITNGVLFGVGQGFANVPGTLMVSKYFVKRRGLANAVTAASAAIGGVFFPLMMQAMLEEYGIPGTYLMLGGIHLHTIISAMLYRPLEVQREIMRLDRRRRLIGRRQSEPLTAACRDELSEQKSQANVPSSVHLLPDGPREEERAASPSLSGRQEDGLLHPPLRHRRPSATLDTSTSMLSQLNLAVEAPAAPPSAGCWQQVLRSLDVHLLTQPLYLACAASVFLFMTGLPHACLLVPRFGLEIGVSRGQTATMIATIAPIDIVSRLLLGFILDRNLFHKRYGLFFTCMVGGVGVLALAFVHSYAGLFAACTIIYAAVGFYFVVTPVMYAEYYGVERLSSTLTISNLFAGLSNLIAQPLGGVLRDATGTFRTVFAVLATCMMAGAGLVLLHPCIIRATERSQKKAESEQAA